MNRLLLPALCASLLLPSSILQAAEEGPPPEPPVKVTTFALPHPDVPEETMVGVMRSLETGLKRNPRLEMRDLDARLADFAQEIPQDQVDNARNQLKEGEKALLELDVSKAVQLLQDAVTGLGKVLPYIKKQELADAMAALAVAYYEGGDKKMGRQQFVRLLVWRSDYIFDPQKLPPKYIQMFEDAQKDVEKAKRGSLQLTSEPTGSQAYVDGKYIGITPCLAEGLVVGEHYVTLRKEGYHKAVAQATVIAKREEKVLVNLERSEKYLLVEQAIAKVQQSLGADMADPEIDNLKQVLYIEHAVFVKAKATADGQGVDIETYLYDTRTRRRLSRVQKAVPKAQAEAELAQLASNLYLNVSYEPELVAPKDAPPPPKQVRTPIYKTWWFWTAAGVVVVGGVGAGVAIDQTRPPSCPDGLGCVIVKE